MHDICTLTQEQQDLFQTMAAAGIPRRYTHCMAGFMPEDEWAYATNLTQLAHGQSGIVSGTSTQVTGTCSQLSSCLDSSPGSVITAPALAPAELSGTSASLIGTRQQQLLQQEQQHVQALQGQVLMQQSLLSQQELDLGLLVMPSWLKQLAMGVAGCILGQPETFR